MRWLSVNAEHALVLPALDHVARNERALVVWFGRGIIIVSKKARGGDGR
jgi:hypothetical protein